MEQSIVSDLETFFFSWKSLNICISCLSAAKRPKKNKMLLLVKILDQLVLKHLSRFKIRGVVGLTYFSISLTYSSR